MYVNITYLHVYRILYIEQYTHFAVTNSTFVTPSVFPFLCLCFSVSLTNTQTHILSHSMYHSYKPSYLALAWQTAALLRCLPNHFGALLIRNSGYSFCLLVVALSLSWAPFSLTV
jgi:hypothetical protein